VLPTPCGQTSCCKRRHRPRSAGAAGPCSTALAQACSCIVSIWFVRFFDGRGYFHSPGKVDATRTQKGELRIDDWRKPAGPGLDGRGLTAGRCRPPCGDVVKGLGKAGRAKRLGAAHARMQSHLHFAPSVHRAASHDGFSRRQPGDLKSLLVSILITSDADRANPATATSTGLLPDPPSKIQPPLFEDLECGSLTDSAGGPGGVWRRDNTMRCRCKIVNVASFVRFAGIIASLHRPWSWRGQ